MSEHSRRITVACHYAQELGWHVFPCSPKTKRPLTKHGFKDANRDRRQIEEWWRQRPEALIGVPTGSQQGFVVLDVDIKDGRDGWRALAARGLTIPRTWMARTRSGGVHVYFKHPGERVRNAAPLKIGGRTLEANDLRGDGGYVIAPGLRDGYRWSRWRPGRCDLAPPPAWLAEHWMPSFTVPSPGVAARRLSMAQCCWNDLAHIEELIASAAPGTRNETLAAQSWRAGRLVAEGSLVKEQALKGVLSAVDRMDQAPTSNGPWSHAAAVATAERCFREGVGHG